MHAKPRATLAALGSPSLVHLLPINTNRTECWTNPPTKFPSAPNNSSEPSPEIRTNRTSRTNRTNRTNRTRRRRRAPRDVNLYGGRRVTAPTTGDPARDLVACGWFTFERKASGDVRGDVVKCAIGARLTAIGAARFHRGAFDRRKISVTIRVRDRKRKAPFSETLFHLNSARGSRRRWRRTQSCAWRWRRTQSCA